MRRVQFQAFQASRTEWHCDTLTCICVGPQHGTLRGTWRRTSCWRRWTTWRPKRWCWCWRPPTGRRTSSPWRCAPAALTGAPWAGWTTVDTKLFSVGWARVPVRIYEDMYTVMHVVDIFHHVLLRSLITLLHIPPWIKVNRGSIIKNAEKAFFCCFWRSFGLYLIRASSG